MVLGAPVADAVLLVDGLGVGRGGWIGVSAIEASFCRCVVMVAGWK